MTKIMTKDEVDQWVADTAGAILQGEEPIDPISAEREFLYIDDLKSAVERYNNRLENALSEIPGKVADQVGVDASLTECELADIRSSLEIWIGEVRSKLNGTTKSIICALERYALPTVLDKSNKDGGR